MCVCVCVCLLVHTEGRLRNIPSATQSLPGGGGPRLHQTPECSVNAAPWAPAPPLGGARRVVRTGGSGSPRILPLLLRVGPAVCPPSWLLTSHVLVLTVEDRFAYVLSPERPWESPVSLASGHAPCSAPHVQSRPRPCHGVTRVAKSPEATADWQGVGGSAPLELGTSWVTWVGQRSSPLQGWRGRAAKP